MLPLLLLYGYFRSPFFQSNLTKTINSVVSAQLHAHFELHRIDIKLARGLTLQHVFLGLSPSDTLFYANEISVNFKSLIPAERKLHISNVEISELQHHNIPFEENNTLSTFLEKLLPENDSLQTESTAPLWKISVDKLLLSNSTFYFLRDYEQDVAGMFNPENMHLQDINILATNIVNEGSNVSLFLDSLSTRDHSGLEVRKLHSDITLNDSIIHLRKTTLETPHSAFALPTLKLQYDDWTAFSNFISDVTMELNIAAAYKSKTGHQFRTHISTNDLAYFVQSLKGMDEELFFTGRINGTVDDLQSDYFKLSYGNSTFVELNFVAKDLPNFDIAHLYCDIPVFRANVADFEGLKIPGKDGLTVLDLPDMAKNLNLLRFKGRFNGTMSDFKSYGHLTTHYGELLTTLHMQPNETTERIGFTGNLKGMNLRVGKILDITSIGNSSFNFNVDGNFKGKDIAVKLNGGVDSLDYANYRYKNIKINGDLVDNVFDGNIQLRDPNIDFGFDGKVDLNEKIYDFDFVAYLNYADLYALNLDTTSRPAIFSVDAIDVNFTASTIDDIVGKINLSNMEYKNEFERLQVKDMAINAFNEYDVKIMTLKSDFVNAEVAGKYKYDEIVYEINNFIYAYLPNLRSNADNAAYQLKTPNYEKITDQATLFELLDKQLKFDIRLNDTRELSRIFLPDYYISPGTSLSGSFYYLVDSLFLNLATDSIAVSGNNVTNTKLHAQSHGSKLLLTLESEKLEFSNGRRLEEFNFISTLSQNKTDVQLYWYNSEYLNGNLYFDLEVGRNEADTHTILQLASENSYFLVDSVEWRISSSALTVDSTAIHVENLKIYQHNKPEEYAMIDGTVSNIKTDKLKIQFNRFELDILNNLTEEDGLSIEGQLNGQLELVDLYNVPIFYTNDSITNLKVSDYDIGDVYIVSSLDEPNKRIRLEIDNLARRNFKSKTYAYGYYYPENQTLEFDSISIWHFRTSALQPLLVGYLSNLKGYINGNLQLYGTISKPELSGEIIMAKNLFTVDYLQTTYNLSDTINISTNSISFNDLQLQSGDRTATVNGIVRHNFFRDIEFDLSIFTKDFHFLNTSYSDSAYYYGKAYAAADISVRGTPSDINMDVNATTKKGTYFYIPLSSSSEIAESNFIRFVNPQANKKPEEEADDYTYGGMQINFNLNVTPDAEIQLIFDEKVGDIIKARGEGELKLMINTNGDFNMYGDLRMVKGDYMFTLNNTVSKRFVVEPGGVLKWSGDPYNADIDLNAIYSLKRVSLYDLTMDSEQDERVNVDCNLRMTNKLMNPNINFGIDLRGAGEDIESQVNALATDDINKQIISLLLINKFQPLPGLKPDPLSIPNDASVASEIFTNQLSHWLSQISNSFDIGLDYDMSDSISSSELEVALSTQLLNDRLIINGNFGVGGQTTTSNIIGDLDVEYKIDKRGKLRAKAFTKANDDIIYETEPYSYGLGIFYRHEFDRIFDRKKWLLKRKSEEESE